MTMKMRRMKRMSRPGRMQSERWKGAGVWWVSRLACKRVRSGAGCPSSSANHPGV